MLNAQDLSYELIANDLELHPMQDIAKPAYLETIVDPSFGTTIRRISDVGTGDAIVPLYNTIQPWNADESLMLVYETGTGHQLLNGMTYEFIRYLDDIYPADIEQLFWDFDEPDILYYLDNPTKDFIRYTVSTQNQEILVNFEDVTDNCSGNFSLGNDVQMMSWNSDIVGFRCNNDRAYYYQISTDELVEFNISNINWTAPMPGPSGELFYHHPNVYDTEGNLYLTLNEANVEHSCLGRLPNGHDANFAISFAQGPNGGCLGDIIAHDMVTGDCFPVISQSQGYNYSQSGTHHSALAHNNTEGGWLAASMVGYDEDGQSLLDQELVIARAEQGNVQVYRIGHHRSDENEFDFFGEPHASISPSGTRVLFASDWSGSEDGQSVDCYVVELPIFELMNNSHVTVNLRVFLEGAINANGTMNTTLQEEGLIPEVHPYTAAPYNYTTANSPISIPDGTVDWVLVEARTGTPSLSGSPTTTTIETQVGLLGSDGYIRHVATGNALVFTELSATESYHFVVRHRNHLDIMSATSLSGSTINYDFTTASTQAFGAAQLTDFAAENATLWTMYAGDFDYNGVIQVTDYNTWSAFPAQLNTYTSTDATLDGVVQVSDYDAWFPNKAKLGIVEIQF